MLPIVTISRRHVLQAIDYAIPNTFSEYLAIVAAAISNGPRAVEMSVHVVRAFVQLRELLASNAEVARRLDEFEGRPEHHDRRSPPSSWPSES